MKQALQALIAEMEYVLSCINENKVPFDGDDFHEALRLGKEALAQQNPQGVSNEQVEPCNMGDICIGCSPRNADGSCPDEKPNMSCACYVVGFNDGMKEIDGMTPYDYTHPPVPTAQPKPLTDGQILSVARDHYNPHQRAEISFARAIEAAHGIKD